MKQNSLLHILLIWRETIIAIIFAAVGLYWILNSFAVLHTIGYGVLLTGMALAYARAMNLPVLWKRSGEYLKKRGLVASWRNRGQVALHVIGGRGVTLDNSLCSTMATGFSNLLAHLKVTMATLDNQSCLEVTQDNIEVHRAACGGFFVPEVRVGTRVQPGRLLGYLQSPIGGERIYDIRAKNAGIVMTLRANPLIHAQELLVRIAQKT